MRKVDERNYFLVPDFEAILCEHELCEHELAIAATFQKSSCCVRCVMFPSIPWFQLTLEILIFSVRWSPDFRRTFAYWVCEAPYASWSYPSLICRPKIKLPSISNLSRHFEDGFIIG